MKIISVPPKGMFQTNCFVIISDKNNAVMIEAPANALDALRIIEENGAVLKKILLTHGHCDHIELLSEVQEKSGAEVYIHKNDAAKLTDDNLNLVNAFKSAFPNMKHCKNYKEISNGEVITLDELSFEVIHTAGHTSGSVCYKIADTIFTGDTLFYRSIGRTDMIDGDVFAMRKTLEFLANYPTETDYTIYCGHERQSTLIAEKKFNTYLQKQGADFI